MGLPRLQNPTAFALQSAQQGLDKFTDRAWKQHMNEQLGGAMTQFFEGDASSLDNLVKFAAETGDLAYIAPIIRDRMRDVSEERELQARRQELRGTGGGIFDTVIPPNLGDPDIRQAWIEAYAVDPASALTSLSARGRSIQSQAYDPNKDPRFQQINQLNPGGRLKVMRSAPRGERGTPQEGHIIGPPTYNPTAEDYSTLAQYPFLSQLPTSRMDPGTLENFYGKLISGQPLETEDFEFMPGLDPKEALSIATDEAVARYYDKEDLAYRDIGQLLQNVRPETLSLDVIARLASGIYVDYLEWHGENAIEELEDRLSFLKPGQTLNSDWREFVKKTEERNPFFFRALQNLVTNPDDIREWYQAPGILDKAKLVWTTEDFKDFKEKNRFFIQLLEDIDRLSASAHQGASARMNSALIVLKGLGAGNPNINLGGAGGGGDPSQVTGPGTEPGSTSLNPPAGQIAFNTGVTQTEWVGWWGDARITPEYLAGQYPDRASLLAALNAAGQNDIRRNTRIADEVDTWRQ